VRQFSADYLADTRQGLWTDREALAPLRLDTRKRILDVGCGTGAVAAVLAAESDVEVVCRDADPALLAEVEAGPRLLGDATRLPVRDGAFDLVACQALLVNLRTPVDAVRELARASSELVAAVEPNNAEVTVESTVEAEAPLAARARRTYLDGLAADATLGGEAAALFEAAGLRDVETTRHDLVRQTAPPYEPRDLEAARRKAAGSRLAEQAPELRAGGLSAEAYEAFLAEWQSMGRAVVDQMRDGAYRRTETVPFYVTVGRV
jgi:SAM-dependent methyltransferase